MKMVYRLSSLYCRSPRESEWETLFATKELAEEAKSNCHGDPDDYDIDTVCIYESIDECYEELEYLTGAEQ